MTRSSVRFTYGAEITGTSFEQEQSKTLCGKIRNLFIEECSRKNIWINFAEDGVGGKFGEDALYATWQKNPTNMNSIIPTTLNMPLMWSTKDYSDEPILGSLTEIREIQESCERLKVGVCGLRLSLIEFENCGSSRIHALFASGAGISDLPGEHVPKRDAFQHISSCFPVGLVQVNAWWSSTKRKQHQIPKFAHPLTWAHAKDHYQTRGKGLSQFCWAKVSKSRGAYVSGSHLQPWGKDQASYLRYSQEIQVRFKV